MQIFFYVPYSNRLKIKRTQKKTLIDFDFNFDLLVGCCPPKSLYIYIYNPLKFYCALFYVDWDYWNEYDMVCIDIICYVLVRYRMYEEGTPPLQSPRGWLPRSD